MRKNNVRLFFSFFDSTQILYNNQISHSISQFRNWAGFLNTQKPISLQIEVTNLKRIFFTKLENSFNQTDVCLYEKLFTYQKNFKNVDF